MSQTQSQFFGGYLEVIFPLFSDPDSPMSSSWWGGKHNEDVDGP